MLIININSPHFPTYYFFVFTSDNCLANQNFLQAGALAGINTIGSSNRNANLQLRREHPNPTSNVGPWNQSTIEPDQWRKPLDGCD